MLFDTFGVMIDCSRNAVMTVDELKRFITLIQKMGYNQVQLYMEDTYEVDDEPRFGYLRGRYSQAELKELDDFCFGIGVELVPCVQTLAHMTAAIRWPEYAAITDIDDVLLVDEERTYELIERMITSLRRCFRTENLHIGMDEADHLGRGKYFDLHGTPNHTDLLLRHLNRVCDIADRHGFKPMMWSDMFYRLASGGQYYTKIKRFDPAVQAMIPQNLTLVYWDYYNFKKQGYTDMIQGHKTLTDKVAFAGGAWKWVGFAPHNALTIRSTKSALSACIENGVRNAFMTCWGDNGAETSLYAVLPSLCYAACRAQGVTRMADVKAKFAEWTGCAFDDFMLLDLPDRIDRELAVNYSKFFLYNDCLMGQFDTHVKAEYAKRYASAARRLKNAAKRTGDYAYLFDTAAKLCDLLAHKVDLGVRTRAAYLAKDMAATDAVIADYQKTIKKLEIFYAAFRAQWMRENKPHGFDVQDARLGGLMQRLKSSLQRLTLWRDGKLDRIDELEETILEFPLNKTGFNCWANTVSANPV